MAIFDPILYTEKQVFMQRLIDSAKAGYVDYVAGKIPLNQALNVVPEFDRAYGVGIKKDARALLKLNGAGDAVLHIWQPQPNHPIHYVLMISEGHHRARQLEALCNLQNHAINVTGFELIFESSRPRGKCSWTWRLSEQIYSAWRKQIGHCSLLQNTAPASSLYARLHRLPRFDAIDLQVSELVDFFRSEWKKRKRDPQFFQPQTPFYPRRLRIFGTSLRQVVMLHIMQRTGRDGMFTSFENEEDMWNQSDYFFVQEVLQTPLFKLSAESGICVVADRKLTH